MQIDDARTEIKSQLLPPHSHLLQARRLCGLLLLLLLLALPLPSPYQGGSGAEGAGRVSIRKGGRENEGGTRETLLAAALSLEPGRGELDFFKA